MRIVLFCFEHLPACSLGCYGDWHIATPEIDAIASRSFVFENYFVSPDSHSFAHELAANVPHSAWLTPHLHPEDFRSKHFQHVLQYDSDELPTADQIKDFFTSSQANVIGIHVHAHEVDSLALDEAATRWLQQSQPDENPEEETEGALSEGSVATEIAITPFASLAAWQQPVIQHAAEVRELDLRLSAWLEIFEEVLEEGDALILTALNGDIRRIPDDREEWLKSVAEPVVHLPFIIHHVGSEESARVIPMLDHSIAISLIAECAAADDLNAILERKLSESPTHLYYESQYATAVRTDKWLMLTQKLQLSNSVGQAPAEAARQLFCKPQDVWEIHDVSSQFPDLLERLIQLPDSPF